jgi:hypothetical protein
LNRNKSPGVDLNDFEIMKWRAKIASWVP